jgi:hypothetical protein
MGLIHEKNIPDRKKQITMNELTKQLNHKKINSDQIQEKYLLSPHATSSMQQKEKEGR